MHMCTKNMFTSRHTLQKTMETTHAQQAEGMTLYNINLCYLLLTPFLQT